MRFDSPRRDWSRIFAEVLDLCIKPQAKTRVMQDVNLSYRQAQRYLSQLLRLDLLRTHRGGMFVTSEKGFRFLQKYIEIQQMLAEEGDSVFPSSLSINSQLLATFSFK